MKDDNPNPARHTFNTRKICNLHFIHILRDSAVLCGGIPITTHSLCMNLQPHMNHTLHWVHAKYVLYTHFFFSLHAIHILNFAKHELFYNVKIWKKTEQCLQRCHWRWLQISWPHNIHWHPNLKLIPSMSENFLCSRLSFAITISETTNH